MSTDTIPNYLYHYTNIDTLALILKNRTIRFNSLINMDDLQERQVADLETMAGIVFVSCWTDQEHEIIPMWKMYSSLDAGIRIKMRSFPFEKYEGIPEKLNHFNGRYAVSGQERYDYTLISEDEMINQRFWCPDALHAEDNAYLYKVEYTNDKEKLYPTLFREGDKGKYIKMNLLGKYKSEYWSFQNEWRYLLQCYPDHFTLNEELQARFVEIATNLIKNGDFKPIFSHIDLKVSQESFEDMEITLAPCVTEGQRAIVEALKASYNPNLVIRDSALSGLIR